VCENCTLEGFLNMRATPKVLGVAVSALALALFLPASSSAGTITITDLANDTIVITGGDPTTTARLNTANCNTSESALSCIFGISAPTGTVSLGTSLSNSGIISLMEPNQTFASDNFHETDIGGGLTSSWSFASDAEGGISPLANAVQIIENGSPQLVVTLSYHNVDGTIFATDQIFIQSDLDPVATPEPASASLLLLGGGILVAAGRLRKRVHE
jgi:hypothetical protein